MFFPIYLTKIRKNITGLGSTLEAGIDEVLTEVAGKPGPICLLDMGDNVGGGSAGDGTYLARALLQRGSAGAFVCLCDPGSVQQAVAATAEKATLGQGTVAVPFQFCQSANRDS